MMIQETDKKRAAIEATIIGLVSGYYGDWRKAMAFLLGRLEAVEERAPGRGPIRRVYLASPYSKGNPCVNVRRQHDAYDRLVKEGYLPFAPLLSHYQEIVHPLPYEKWLEIDLAWIEVCDALVRLPGESPGADREVEHAKKCGLKVYMGIDDLLYWDKGGYRATV